MLKFFETLLNMSITGAVIIAFVMIVRLFLKKLPRRYSYILWIIPAIRLLIPFSVAAPVSVFNYIHIPEPHAVIEQTEVTDAPALTDDIFTEPITSPITVPITDAVIGEVTDDGYFDSVPDGWYTGENAPQIPGPVYTFDVITNAPAVTEAPVASDTPVSDEPNTALILWRTACAVWALGTAGMFGYLAYTFAATKKQIEFSYKIGDGLYSNAYIETPFVFGYIKPRIYVPFGLNDKQFEYVVAHEKTHIKRGDHIIKAAASLILCVHWFNPFAWLAFKLMTVDMELSCDERAINTYDLDVRKDYARALLNMCVVSKKVPFHGMLSFGESSIKSRIKGILRMKKPAAWACVLAVAVMITAAVCLLTNAEQTPPDKVGEDTTDSVETTEPADTDEPAIPDVPSPYMAEPNSVVYSFAVCADMYEYVVQTEYDDFGRPIKETYLPEFMQADLGYYAYEYDAEGRLVKWIIGGTLSGVDVSVSFRYAEDGFVNSEVTYPKLPVYDQNKPYAATVEYHDNGVIKLLRLGEIYRKYDEFGRRTEEAGDCPVPSDAYYLFDDSADRALINNGVFTLEYHDGSMLPHLGCFVYDYGRDEASYETRTLYCSAVFEGNYLKGVASSTLGIVDPDNVPDTGYSYSADGKLLPQFASVEYDEKGQLVSVIYESGTITVDGAELPAKAAYIKYTYDGEGKLVYESREMRELGSQGEINYKKTNEYTYTDGLRAVTEKGYNYNAYITAKESGYEITREYHENGVVKKETELSFTVSSYRSESHTVSEYSDWGFIVNRTVEHRSYDKVMRYEYVYRYGASGMNVSDCVEKCYENEKLYYTRTTNYYTGGGVLKDEYQYYHDGETVGNYTYRIYDSQGRVLRERLYKGAQAYVNEYSYIYGETESALVHTLEQAIDNYLRLDSQLFPPSGKGGVNARQYSDLKYDTEHESAGWIAWRYLQSPLAENYGLAELDGTYRVYDALIEWTVSKEDKLSSIVIVVQRGAESYDVIAEVKLAPKDISGTVSKAGELSADGKWQYYILDSNGTKYRFYAPVGLGVKADDKVTVTFNGTPSIDTDVDNVTLKVLIEEAAPPEVEDSELQGTVSDVGELTADGTGRKCLLQINVLHYAFTAPADMDIRVGDLVTVTFAGEVQKGRNGENNTLSVISHEDPNRTVTAVKHSFTVSVKNSPSLGKMNVDIEFPSDWERNGTGTVLSRNGVKFFELSSAIAPYAMGIDEDSFKTSAQSEVTVIEERYGTDGDPYEYYIYHSRPPADKYGPDATYDVHSYVVLSNGYYVTLGFLGDADIPQDVIDRVLRSVDVFADANANNDGEIFGELFGDIRYMAIKYGTLTLDVVTLDEATVEHIKSFVDTYSEGTVTGIAFTNKNLSITCSPTRISERVLNFTVPENCIEYVTVDGVIYSSDNKVLIAMPPARAGSYSLPNAVERMDDYALYGSKLASLNIPALLNDRGALIGADNVKIYQK